MVAMPTLRRFLTLACVAVATTSAAAAQARPTCSSTAIYVDVSGTDTIGVSRVMLTNTSFESTTRAVSQEAFLRYRGHRTRDGNISDIHIEVWPPKADTAGPPGQIADLSVDGPRHAAECRQPHVAHG